MLRQRNNSHHYQKGASHDPSTCVDTDAQNQNN